MYPLTIRRRMREEEEKRCENVGPKSGNIIVVEFVVRSLHNPTHRWILVCRLLPHSPLSPTQYYISPNTHTHFPPSILQLFFVVPRRVLCVRMWEFERCVKVSRDRFRSFWEEKKSKGEKQQIQMLQYRSQKRNISRKKKKREKDSKKCFERNLTLDCQQMPSGGRERQKMPPKKN